MKIPLPQRGQPLDVSFLYDIVNSINELWGKIAINISSYSTLWTKEQSYQNVRSSEVKIFTAQYEIPSDSIGKEDEYKTFSVDFGISFKYVPVVTATPIASTTASAADKSATAIITEVSTSKVSGVVKFPTKGTASVSVNIIAIGVPVS